MQVWQTLPHSVREINGLPNEEKLHIYRALLPSWLASSYRLDLETLTIDGNTAVWVRCPSGSRAVEITVKRHPRDRDPIFYANIADTFNNQILVLMLTVNDMDSVRFNTDIDPQGNRTHYGTASRNIPAEVEAMNYGLAPGQVRQGLRVFGSMVPGFESFIQKMGHNIFFIEPLAYHNAIVFERYGFNYVRGLSEMRAIHRGFSDEGHYRVRLDGRTPFRHSDAWNSIRGRSWAIHDGILGHPFTGFQMYKRLGQSAEICTAPGIKW